MSNGCLGTMIPDASRLAEYGGEYARHMDRFMREGAWLRVVDHQGSREQYGGHELGDETVSVRPTEDADVILDGMVGSSAALRAVLNRAIKVAATDSTVLITGETGTGKDLLARAIHMRSPRAAHPFVSVNCAAIPQSLISSELFGHERGAFTGAVQRRLGRFELAARGTLFLDEIGELPAETQVALLRVLQEHEFERVGSTTPRRTDVRVIAATNRNLEEEIAAGRFRSDLYYRLNVFPIEMPPLHERRADIRMLVDYFIERYARRAGKRITRIEKRTLELLEAHSWPGNIRELQNVVERSVIVCDSEVLAVDESWLVGPAAPSKPAVGPPAAAERATPRAVEAADSHARHPATLEEVQREAILRALHASNWLIGGPRGAATLLGLKRTTLQARMRKLGIAQVRAVAASSR